MMFLFYNKWNRIIGKFMLIVIYEFSLTSMCYLTLPFLLIDFPILCSFLQSISIMKVGLLLINKLLSYNPLTHITSIIPLLSISYSIAVVLFFRCCRHQMPFRWRVWCCVFMLTIVVMTLCRGFVIVIFFAIVTVSLLICV